MLVIVMLAVGVVAVSLTFAVFSMCYVRKMNQLSLVSVPSKRKLEDNPRGVDSGTNYLLTQFVGLSKDIEAMYSQSTGTENKGRLNSIGRITKNRFPEWWNSDSHPNHLDAVPRSNTVLHVKQKQATSNLYRLNTERAVMDVITVLGKMLLTSTK